MLYIYIYSKDCNRLQHIAYSLPDGFEGGIVYTCACIMQGSSIEEVSFPGPTPRGGRYAVYVKRHDHNVSAYTLRSVNAWGVVNFASTVCTYYPGQSTFPC